MQKDRWIKELSREGMLKRKNRTNFDMVLGVSPYLGTSVYLELNKNYDGIKFV